jgi:hypothetical protein
MMEPIHGQTIECDCGKTHHVEPQRVIYENSALSRLPEVLSEYTTGRRVVALMDIRTREVAGRSPKSSLRILPRERRRPVMTTRTTGFSVESKLPMWFSPSAAAC